MKQYGELLAEHINRMSTSPEQQLILFACMRLIVKRMLTGLRDREHDIIANVASGKGPRLTFNRNQSPTKFPKKDFTSKRKTEPAIIDPQSGELSFSSSL